MNSYDVIVVGGGHAGIEAVCAAAKMGVRVLLITLDADKIGLMPCNPSIGGLGKGHIVYEIAAFDGLMPRLASQTFLQARMLNTKKGPAVQGLRVQIDKDRYRHQAGAALRALPNLTIREGMVSELIITRNGADTRVSGVRCKDGTTFYASSVVLTTGTFLNGKIFMGEESNHAGRMGEQAAQGLSASLQDLLGATLGRLKTGTPPRLKRDSIDFTYLERQDAHSRGFLFEFHPVKAEEKIPCYITYTNQRTHEIIRKNLDRSAMYSGAISGVGPRYCPSIEDKIGRFANKTSHHIFIEPESATSDEVYPAGLSTSLPRDVQEEYIRSIVGFERAEITKYGYAVEYDFVQPTCLNHTLECKSVAGLFLAGQINGTTGYEEAAGQGLIAGINAAGRVLGNKPFILDRLESYIGVMIDDLVTLGVNEPYRMFTSRAERRLFLRQDNAFIRLMPRAYNLGLISDELYDAFTREKEVLEHAISWAMRSTKSSLYTAFNVIEFSEDSQRKAAQELVAHAQREGWSDTGYTLLAGERVLLGIHAAIKYDGYLQREFKEIEKARRYATMTIASELCYTDMPGLSRELQEKLIKFKPRTIAQAQLIPGMTPAAISLLIFQNRMLEKKRNVQGDA